jgi:serine/threonine protein kinase
LQDRVINNYRITRQIGAGGMGVVFLAQHEVIERQVAIKLLREEFAGDEGLVTRFFNEARAAAAAKHPGIVEIIDVGYDGGQAFIMMELIEGITLGKYLRQCERLSPMEAMDLTRQVASALSAAHARDVVHRDLKPSNIMLVPSDIPNRHITKVFDFGIAKLFGENSSHTRTGILMGTPTYMSPEQCKGAAKVDHRSDLYSLGCILYSLLTGKRVFTGEGEGEVIAKHIYEPPTPPIDFVPLPEDLNSIVLRLLEKDPDHRYQKTEELIEALDSALNNLNAEGQETTEIFRSEDYVLPLPVEPMTPTPRARALSLDTLDPDPNPGPGTPLATEGRTVPPEPTGFSKRRSLPIALTLLVGVGSLSLVLYLRAGSDDSPNRGASQGVVEEDNASPLAGDEPPKLPATDLGANHSQDAGTATETSGADPDAAAALVLDVDSKDQSPDPDKVPTKNGKNKSGKTGGNKGSKTGKDKPDNDEGPAGPRTLNPFE